MTQISAWAANKGCWWILDIYTLHVLDNKRHAWFTCCRVEGTIIVYYYSLREEGMKVTLVAQSSVAQFPPLGPSPISGALFAVFSLQYNATRTAALNLRLENGLPSLTLANALANTATLTPLTGKVKNWSLHCRAFSDLCGETPDLVGFMGQRTTTWGLGPGVSH